MARNRGESGPSDGGTVHVGIRHYGATVWPVPARSWELFDRVTGATLLPVDIRTLGLAVVLAQAREHGTFGHVPGIPCDGPHCR